MFTTSAELDKMVRNVRATYVYGILNNEDKDSDKQRKRKFIPPELACVQQKNGYSISERELSPEKYLNEFKEINGVFMKLYDPRRVVPVYVMDYCIGYYVLYETMQHTTTNVLNAVHTLSRTSMMFQTDRRKTIRQECTESECEC